MDWKKKCKQLEEENLNLHRLLDGLHLLIKGWKIGDQLRTAQNIGSLEEVKKLENQLSDNEIEHEKAMNDYARYKGYSNWKEALKEVYRKKEE